MNIKIDKGAVPLRFEYKGKKYKGKGIPLPASCKEGVCFELNIILNGEFFGQIHSQNGEWIMPDLGDKELVNAIGQQILLWYE